MAVLHVNESNFDTLLTSEQPVLIDFWASWCGPCQMVAPTLAEIAEEKEGELKVGKVNVDEQPELARQFGIMSIPTMIVFKGGEPAAKTVGVQPKEDILKLL